MFPGRAELKQAEFFKLVRYPRFIRHRVAHCALFRELESSVEYQTNDDQKEKDDAKNEERHLAPVKQNPANVKSYGQSYEASSESYEEGY